MDIWTVTAIEIVNTPYQVESEDYKAWSRIEENFSGIGEPNRFITKYHCDYVPQCLGVYTEDPVNLFKDKRVKIDKLELQRVEPDFNYDI